jgi:4-hydroxybenzoate polyprenyltransferase
VARTDVLVAMDVDAPHDTGHPFEADRVNDISTSTSQRTTRVVRELPSLAAALVPRMPAFTRPYLRLARAHAPIGSWLYLLPGLWAAALASPGLPDWRLVLLLAVAAVLVRGFGCTVNDIVDHRIDAEVERTATRPIPAGEVRVRAAVVFAVAQALVALGVLSATSVPAAVVVGASYPLVVAYPFMKRITHWPQAWLGVVFNGCALAGWVAVTGTVELPAVLLFGAAFFWTLGYDTVYAHQDKRDDVLVGVKSTALLFGGTTKVWVLAFYTATTAGIALAGAVADLHWSFFGVVGLAAVQLCWQVWTVDLDDPADCRRKFTSNRYFGWIVLVAIVVGQLL